MAELFYRGTKHRTGCLCCNDDKVVSLVTAQQAADQAAKWDPTGTGRLRRGLAQELSRRWREVQRRARAAMQADLMQLNRADVSMIESTTAEGRAYAFLKHLRPVVVDIMLRELDRCTVFITAAFDKGVKDGHVHTKGDMHGLYASGPRDAMREQFKTDLVRIVSVCMEQIEQRIIIALKNDAPANKVTGIIIDRIEKIGETRSATLAQYLTVKSYTRGTLVLFKHMRVSEVRLVPERTTLELVRPLQDAKKKKRKKPKRVSERMRELVGVLTAGDDEVCPECEDIADAGPYSLSEADDLIPAHPNCRCALVPVHDYRYAEVEN